MTAGMNRRRFLGRAAGVAAGAAAAPMLGAGPASAEARGGGRGPADLIIYNGRVQIMDKHLRTAGAIAIRGGVVIGVGRERDIRRLAGRRTESINAEGGTVLPGINDSHLHLGGYGLDFPPFTVEVNFETIQQIVDAVAAAASAATEPDSWIRGQGWNENRLPHPPTKADLDPVSGNHPVILRDFSGHMMTANSNALRIAGVTRDTPAPPGGIIEKDANGEPNGVLRESAQGLVTPHVPPYTEEETAGAIDAAIELCHAQGITSITDPGITLQQLALYGSKYGAGTLPLRITALILGGRHPDQVREMLDGYDPLRGVDPRMLRVAGMKISVDGVPTAAQTAWLHEPYVDGSNATPVTQGDTIEEQVANLHTMIRLAHDAGMQVGTHSTGDAGIDAVVAGYLAAMRANPRIRDPRHYIIHGDLTPPKTLRTMARHGIGVSMNATIKYVLGRTLDPHLGPERTDYQWPYRTALDSGVKVASASDAPVTSPSLLQGVQSAVTREGQFGGVAGTAERITVKEALVSYTRTGAWQDHAESWKGTLEPGMAGDVCIVGGDVLGTDPSSLVELPITGTVLGGKVVYDGKATPAIAPAAVTQRNARGAERLQRGACCHNHA
ncbi:amidohydrolase [Actinomadura madurae]|uniref:amidohydrolase n=1 Tax=Actinomadura madurae TaxID=1993 RepID=UPI0020D24193|nr:amidohydrolase [Actinomadura madurae]MCP9949961.1 amidohydrolase [Actinomadura madurae]MCP9966719.1 amidohydrolase [Actinomadura madurae]MCP9979208.1 amidohydrolase [Actinomadura madurae]MCQ0009266.1 amidohydrolase [Actinomadura madurae]